MKWVSWCRTKNHPSTCTCVYPTHVSPGKGEPERPYPKFGKKKEE